MPIYFDITSDPLYKQGYEDGYAKGFIKGRLEGKLKGRLEGKLKGTFLMNLKLLCGMAEVKIPKSVILQGIDVPEPFVEAFLASFSRKKGERLIKAFEKRSGVFIGKTLRHKILRDLKDFGIPKEEAKLYFDWIVSTIIREGIAVKDTESPSPQEAII